MVLEITKTDFEKAVPAAQESSGSIFEVMEDAINNEVANIESQVLGSVGAQAVEAGTDTILVHGRCQNSGSSSGIATHRL